jgi:hypothetical protein
MVYTIYWGLAYVFLLIINIFYVHRVCCQHPFRRSEFQQICEKYFEWTPEKTGILNPNLLLLDCADML